MQHFQKTNKVVDTADQLVTCIISGIILSQHYQIFHIKFQKYLLCQILCSESALKIETVIFPTYKVICRMRGFHCVKYKLYESDGPVAHVYQEGARAMQKYCQQILKREIECQPQSTHYLTQNASYHGQIVLVQNVTNRNFQLSYSKLKVILTCRLLRYRSIDSHIVPW